MNITGLINIFPILLQGLAGVFSVIAVIWLAIAAMLKGLK